jgi:hypothetical protein
VSEPVLTFARRVARALKLAAAIATIEAANIGRDDEDGDAFRVTTTCGAYTAELGGHAVTYASLGGALIELASRVRGGL